MCKENKSGENFREYMHLICKKKSDNVYHLRNEVGAGLMRSYNVGKGMELIYSEIETYYPDYSEQKKLINYIEIMYMVSGHAEFEMENRRCATADKGDVLVFSTNSAVRECRMGAEGMRCISIIAFVDDLADELNRIFGTKDFAKDNIFAEALKADTCICVPAEATLERVFKELLQVSDEYACYRRKLLTLQALLALIDIKDGKRPGYQYFSGDTANKVYKARKLLSDNLSSFISISELAERVSLNRTTLQQVFKQVYGVTINEYRNQIRMQEAKNLLLRGDLSVTEVAGMCGYSNASKFAGTFRKVTGCLPGEWRKRA